MCNYILFLPLCNHYPRKIWSAQGDETCPALRAQLNRIYDPAEWVGDRASCLPFDMPEKCKPGAGNIRVVRIARYCEGCSRFM